MSLGTLQNGLMMPIKNGEHEYLFYVLSENNQAPKLVVNIFYYMVCRRVVETTVLGSHTPAFLMVLSAI